MTFLNPVLLAGIAAAAVPLVIHLLHRSRYQTVSWGAMHLLEDVVQTNQRRLQWHQWLLLAVRILIPILLAVLMARPLLTGFQALRGDRPISLVVVVDDSASMATRSEPDEPTRFDAATAAVEELVFGSPAGSEFVVLLAGQPHRTLLDRPTSDASLLVGALTAVQPRQDAFDAGEVLDEAAVQVAGLSHPLREVVVVSDFESSEWDTGAERPTAAAFDLTLLDVLGARREASASDAIDDVAVAEVESPRRPVSPGQTATVRAVVRNRGDADVLDLPITLRDGTADPETVRVDLPGGGEAQALFRLAVDRPGTHPLTVAIDRDDANAANNTAFCSLDVLDRVRVLLVDGDPSLVPLEGETDYVAIALAPFAAAAADRSERRIDETTEAGPLAVESIDADVWDRQPFVADRFDVIVLANVPRLSESTVDGLAGFVRDGGAAIWTAGSRIDRTWANETLVPRGLLPHVWAEPLTVRTAPLVETYTHPAVSAFNEPNFGDLSTATIRRWSPLRPFEAPANASPPSELSEPAVALRLRDGSPLLAVASLGQGTIHQWAIPLDADASDLPLKPFFVPLMQQTVTAAAAGGRTPKNLRPGDPLPLDTASTNRPRTVRVTRPDGSSRSIELRATSPGNEGEKASSTDESAVSTRDPGFYVVTARGTDDAGRTGPDDTEGESPSTTHYAVAIDPAEFDSAPLDPERLAAIADGSGASLAADVRSYRERDREARYGRDIWTPVWAILLGLLIGEVVLQRLLSGGRRPSGGRRQ